MFKSSAANYKKLLLILKLFKITAHDDFNNTQSVCPYTSPRFAPTEFQEHRRSQAVSFPWMCTRVRHGVMIYQLKSIDVELIHQLTPKEFKEIRR